MNKKPLSRRSSHTQLPAGNEIMHISDAEQKRTPHHSKIDIHYPDFSTIRAIYEHVGLDSGIYDISDQAVQDILDIGAQHIDSLVGHILASQNDVKLIRLLEQAYAYLSEEDSPEQSDFIFVFGAKTLTRIERAIELFQENLAPRMILSGHGPYYGGVADISEAEVYAQRALEAGVPESALILEPKSITMPDNVRRTLNMLDEQGVEYNSFILVNSPYTQRRGWCTWKKHTPDTVQLFRVNSTTAEHFSYEHWYKHEDGIRVVLNEFVKLRNTIAFNDA